MDITKYYALIEWFDEHCGELIAHLEKKGIKDDTLIVYLSANGWVSIRRRGDYAPRSKGSPYDAGVRSPIIYSWPARIRPAVSASLASSVDVVPTILAAAGARSPKKEIPGMNLLPVMEGKANIDDRAIFGEAFARDVANIQNPEAVLLKRWVIHKQYKLILTYDGQGTRVSGSRSADRATGPELYDLVSDPFEQNNLYGKLPKVYESLRSRLDNWYPLKKRKVFEGA
jgi:arylsulfatase A-like enzyme